MRARCAVVALAILAVPAPIGAYENHAEHTHDWERIEGGAETGCALGSPFAFWIHRGDPARLTIYFAGGGACWSAQTCDPKGAAPYAPSIPDSFDPATLGGMLAVHDTASPIAGHTLVVVPYCTGDVHLGARDTQYRDDLVVRHRGRPNAQAALAWVEANVPSPQLIFVAGSSAGAIPSPVYAAQLGRRYPEARVVQLGDAAGGYQRAGGLITWGGLAPLRTVPGFESLTPDNLSYPALYTLAARASPNVRFAQVNAVDDRVQRQFLSLAGFTEVRLADLLRENFATLRADDPRFRSYTISGTTHTILGRPSFSTISSGGITLRDWVVGLLAGDDVPDVGGDLLGL